MSCFNCQERHVGCHSTCERYAAWLQEKKEAKSNETASIAEESAWWLSGNNQHAIDVIKGILRESGLTFEEAFGGAE